MKEKRVLRGFKWRYRLYRIESFIRLRNIVNSVVCFSGCISSYVNHRSCVDFTHFTPNVPKHLHKLNFIAFIYMLFGKFYYNTCKGSK